jgi:hypothetical protein
MAYSLPYPMQYHFAVLLVNVYFCAGFYCLAAWGVGGGRGGELIAIVYL